MLLPSTCSRASLKTDAFVYNHSTLIQIPVEEKNLIGNFDLRSMSDVLALAVGALLISLHLGEAFRPVSWRQFPGTFMKNPAVVAFRALSIFNFRVWSAGALVSNIGTWMQRVAQDWLVLTQLTHHDASAVGVVMALQFAPQLLLLPWTGFAADHLNQRKLLMVTQATMGCWRWLWESLRSRAMSVFGRSMYLRFCLARRPHWMLPCARLSWPSWWVTSTCIMQSRSIRHRSTPAVWSVLQLPGLVCEGGNWLGVCDQRAIIRRGFNFDVTVPRVRTLSRHESSTYRRRISGRVPLRLGSPGPPSNSGHAVSNWDLRTQLYVDDGC